jgi:hypothetical protein
MRLRAAIEGNDFSDVALIDGLTITQDSTQAISTTNLPLIRRYGESRYDHAVYDYAAFNYTWQVQEWQEVTIWDQDTNAILFGGLILSIERQLTGPHVILNLGLSDWGILFERTIVTQTWPDGTPDSTIVEDLVALVPELSIGTIVTQFANLGAIEAKDQRIRDVLDNLCQLTGSEWNVSYDGKVNYYRSGSIVAPFGLSDEPDGTTLQPYQMETYTSDFSDAANTIVTLGALTEAGEIRGQASDLSSQNQYGILVLTLVDRNIGDAETATIWAQTEVALRSRPKPTVTASLFASGLMRGMTVYVEAAKYGLTVDAVLRTLTIVVLAPDRSRSPESGHRLKYTAVLGWKPPDLIYTLRRMQRKPVERTQAPAAVVPPGSITPGDFASGIAPVFVVDHKPVGAEWNQYPADAVFLNTSDRKLYRRISGNDWTAVVPTSDIEGQLQTHQFAPGSVTTTVLADGSVVTAKIPAGAITAPTIAIGAVTPSAIADGAVVTAKIPAGAITGPQLAASSVTANAIAANAIAATNLQAGSVTAGALAANSVTAGAMAANSVTAASVAASAITATALAAGSVTANAIAANAVYSQAIQANAITSIHLVANAVVAGKIAALAVVAGNIAADAVVAGTIAAGAVRAGNLAANSVTAGTIDVGAVTAQSIQTGSITSDKFNTIEISVGFGGFKPGRIAVYANTGLTALLGDMGGAGLPANTYFGIWARMCGFGGSGYNDAPMRTDTVGNLFLRQVSLTISASDGSSINTSPTTFDSTYGSIALKVDKPGDSFTALVSRGLVVRTSGNTTCGALVRSPTNAFSSELTIYSPGGALNIWLDGITGIARATGFQSGGSPGVSEVVNIGGVNLRFVGGLYTGH